MVVAPRLEATEGGHRGGIPGLGERDFGMAFTALMLTSYMELTRPEPQQRPSGPPMRIMQQLGN